MKIASFCMMAMIVAVRGQVAKISGRCQGSVFDEFLIFEQNNVNANDAQNICGPNTLASIRTTQELNTISDVLQARNTGPSKRTYWIGVEETFDRNSGTESNRNFFGFGAGELFNQGVSLSIANDFIHSSTPWGFNEPNNRNDDCVRLEFETDLNIDEYRMFDTGCTSNSNGFICRVQCDTLSPTKSPTKFPTRIPTSFPSESPTRFPTKGPTKFPTQKPTGDPTSSPTSAPIASSEKTQDDGLLLQTGIFGSVLVALMIPIAFVSLKLSKEVRAATKLKHRIVELRMQLTGDRKDLDAFIESFMM